MAGMGELRARTASALVMAPVALAAVWLGGVWLAALLAAALVVLAAEWRALVAPPAGGTGVLAAALAAALALAFLDRPAAALAVLALGAAAIAALARRGGGGAVAWPAAFGPLYLGAPAVAIVWLRAAPEHGAALAAGLLAVVWATDTGAWAVGRAVGGARLAPHVSPGKTWAGLAGGGALAAFAGAALAPTLGVGMAAGALAGAALAVVAQLADLFESWLKRRRGVKDSGRLIPGHGGLLDRVDGLIGAAPALALLVVAAGGG